MLAACERPAVDLIKLPVGVSGKIGFYRCQIYDTGTCLFMTDCFKQQCMQPIQFQQQQKNKK